MVWLVSFDCCPRWAQRKSRAEKLCWRFESEQLDTEMFIGDPGQQENSLRTPFWSFGILVFLSLVCATETLINRPFPLDFAVFPRSAFAEGCGCRSGGEDGEARRRGGSSAVLRAVRRGGRHETLEVSVLSVRMLHARVSSTQRYSLVFQGACRHETRDRTTCGTFLILVYQVAYDEWIRQRFLKAAWR